MRSPVNQPWCTVGSVKGYDDGDGDVDGDGDGDGDGGDDNDNNSVTSVPTIN